jgi:hypothetical protein
MLAATIACMVMVLMTVSIHYEGLQLVSQALERFRLRRRRAMLLVIFALFALHILEVWLYAGAFRVLALLADGGQFRGEFDNLWSDFLYFSLTSYTSLGIGDVYPQGAMRLLTGIEALNGLVLITWSASYSYLVMERLWGFPGEHGTTRHRAVERRDRSVD